MTMLLDTHVILWAVFESRRLSTRARQLMADPANVLLFSAVSAWEIATKVGTGRLTLHVPVTEFLDAQRTRLKLTDLPLTLVQAAGIAVVHALQRQWKLLAGLLQPFPRAVSRAHVGGDDAVHTDCEQVLDAAWQKFDLVLHTDVGQHTHDACSRAKKAAKCAGSIR